MTKILAICGSTRSQSTNHAILQMMAEKYSEQAEITLYPSISGLPHFNPDLDQDQDQPPPVVKAFRTAIEAADGVLICTPEYVFSLPGTLKNALEWTVSTTIFSEKPTALIVASGLGEIAFESLRLIMQTLGAAVAPNAALHIPGARNKLSNVHTLQDIDRLMNALTESIESRR